MKVLFYSIVVSATLVFAFSCNKASLVGSDLFVPDSIDLFFEDDFEITAATERVDSVITYNGLTSLTTLIVGELDDPVFGKTKAEAYVDLNRSNNITPDFLFMKEGTTFKADLDSVVLILAYQPNAFYGDTSLVHDVEISIIEESPFDGDTLYSSFRPSGTETVIGSASFVPRFSDSIFVTEPGDTSATAFQGQVRIPLENSWAQAMFDDTTLISSNTNLQTYAPGLKISSTSDGSSTWAIDFSTTVEEPGDRIRIYYTKDTVQAFYDIIVNGDRHNYYEHDYTGSELESFIGNAEKGDSLLFLQGMAGTEVEIDLPVVASNQFEDFLVNQAELEFFVLEDPTFNIHGAIESILLQRYTDDGDIVILEDAFVASELLQESTFDGELSTKVIDGMTLKRYSALVTIYTIERFEESNPQTKVRILPRNKSILPNRSIIYGPGHSKYPMKFKLNYSK